MPCLPLTCPLQAANNALTSPAGPIPPCLPQALKDLDVGSNQLTALPESLGSLKQLRYLNAMSNRLAALPEGIGGCTALLRLGLKGNRLVGLPASVGQLASLVELYITGGRWLLD